MRSIATTAIPMYAARAGEQERTDVQTHARRDRQLPHRRGTPAPAAATVYRSGSPGATAIVRRIIPKECSSAAEERHVQESAQRHGEEP